MKQRSPVVVIILSIVTLGIYHIIWSVKTKNEMNAMGANIPTAWLMIVPIVNLWWIWKYCGGVEHVTRGKMSQVIALLVLVLLNQVLFIGNAIIQSEFNKLSAAGLPNARAMG